MFDIQLPNYIVKTRFEHVYPRCSIARIYVLRNDGSLQRYAGGIAYRHPQDQWSKSTGRKVALAKALHSLVPRRYLGVRKMFWNKYFESCGDTR